MRGEEMNNERRGTMRGEEPGRGEERNCERRGDGRRTQLLHNV